VEVVDTFTVLLSTEYFRLRFSPFVRLLVGSKIVKTILKYLQRTPIKNQMDFL
jgi:hypothetical protein